MRDEKYRGYLLTVLLVTLAFNNVDRLALGLVLQEIKVALSLSDTQLGLLTGIAFALFYSFMGIPIARWADRGDRVFIISLTVTVWTLMVAVCGLAASFTQLLLARIGVAVGEAGCTPPAHSLIAEYFNRAERPRAVARYMLGGPLSVVIGYFLAGWINECFGWRMMFLLIGAPGIVLAAIAWYTLDEPRRFLSTPADNAPVQPGFWLVCTTLWANRTFKHLLLGFSVMSFFGYGLGQWQPAFFVRSYGMQTGELGTWFALIYGLGGALGTYIGGSWAYRYAVHNEERQLKVMAVMYGSFGLVSALIYLSKNKYQALALTGLTAIAGAAAIIPLFATIQTLVSPRMRATSIALVYLVANLIGMGLGPLVTGTMSDALRSGFGDESLRYSLLALCPGYFWVGWHLWRGSGTVQHDLVV
jgi:MFS family permease